jgi:putative ATP-dependent endonuclease of OLD family
MTSSFSECLTHEDNSGKKNPCLYIHWNCKYLSTFKPPSQFFVFYQGNGDGPSPAVEARELFTHIYLRALRDD